MYCTCNTIVDSKTLDFTIEGTKYSLPMSILRAVDNSGNCYLLIAAIDFDFIILGAPFLRLYYAIFDEEELKIGLAAHSSVNYDEDVFFPNQVVMDNTFSTGIIFIDETFQEGKPASIAIFVAVVLAIIFFISVSVYTLVRWRRKKRLRSGNNPVEQQEQHNQWAAAPMTGRERNAADVQTNEFLVQQHGPDIEQEGQVQMMVSDPHPNPST